MRSPRLLAAAALVAAATSALAQGTITSGTTQLQFVGTPFAASSGNANLWFGGTFNGTDMLSMIGWSYAQGTGTSIRPFSSLDTPTATYVGDTATFTWANAGSGTAGFARWDAVLTMKLSQVAPGTTNNPGAAVVTSTLNFKANSGNAAAISFSLFNHLNLDIFGTNVNSGPDDVYAVVDANGIRIRAVDSTSATHYGEMQAAGASFYELNNGSVLRGKLGLTTGTSGLANLATAAGVAAANFAGSDGSAAFQWDRTLAPGQSFDVTTSFTINTPIPEPTSWALMALGLAAVGGFVRRRAV